MKKQGYNARLDDSLGARNGKKKTIFKITKTRIYRNGEGNG